MKVTVIRRVHNSQVFGESEKRSKAGILVGVLMAIMLVQGCASRIDRTEAQSDDAAQYNAQLGAQYLQRGELDQAREKLLKALDQDDGNALAHATYAQLQARVSEPASAQVHFKRALQLKPDEADYRNSYGIYLCGEGQYEEAKKQFRTAADNAYYRTPEFALDNAGLCMLDADRLSEAESYLREALRVNPQFGNAYLHMANLMHRRQRLTVADAYYQRFTAYGRESAESLWLGLQIKRDAGQMKTAEQFATRLLNQFPASQEAGEYLSRPIR
ncbi:type IV pilus biogenesis/stability protein PilW [Granulosicoccus sp.]|nr:type IV pilus biogenesis/stability protein PilW [Granulosicoccus sp.]